jgi:hypothetical protein
MGPAKLQPALLGGVAIGVLSALPVINLANCCCAWILFGGGLAAYLMQQNYPGRVGAGDGALVGLMAGAIGAVIYSLLSIPLAAALGPWQSGIIEGALDNAADMPPELRAWLESMRGGGAIMGIAWIMGTLFMLCISSFFGMLGGILGALFFAKDGPPPPPPQDPTFTPPTFRPPPLPPGGQTP